MPVRSTALVPQPFLRNLLPSPPLTSDNAHTPIRRTFYPWHISGTALIETPKGFPRCWVSALLTVECHLINPELLPQQPRRSIRASQSYLYSRILDRRHGPAYSLYKPGVHVDAQ